MDAAFRRKEKLAREHHHEQERKNLVLKRVEVTSTHAPEKDEVVVLPVGGDEPVALVLGGERSELVPVRAMLKPKPKKKVRKLATYTPQSDDGGESEGSGD